MVGVSLGIVRGYGLLLHLLKKARGFCKAFCDLYLCIHDSKKFVQELLAQAFEFSTSLF